jgi:hypothetical protein
MSSCVTEEVSNGADDAATLSRAEQAFPQSYALAMIRSTRLSAAAAAAFLAAVQLSHTICSLSKALLNSQHPAVPISSFNGFYSASQDRGPQREREREVWRMTEEVIRGGTVAPQS